MQNAKRQGGHRFAHWQAIYVVLAGAEHCAPEGWMKVLCNQGSTFSLFAHAKTSPYIYLPSYLLISRVSAYRTRSQPERARTAVGMHACMVTARRGRASTVTTTSTYTSSWKRRRAACSRSWRAGSVAGQQHAYETTAAGFAVPRYLPIGICTVLPSY